MQLALEVLVFGGAVPAAVAAAVFWASRRLLAERLEPRWWAAMALVAALACAHLLRPDWLPLWPDRHWQWVTWAGALAGLLGPIGLARGVSLPERWLILLALAATTAWLVVPTWDDLEPARPLQMALLGGGLFLLAALLDGLAVRISPPQMLAALLVAATATAALVAVVLSFKLGQVTAIVVAGLVGCWAASFLVREATAVRALLPAYAMAIGGAAYAGFIEPMPPMAPLLLLPLAPLALWLATALPASRLGATRATLLAWTLLLLWLVAIAALAAAGFRL